MSRTRYDIALDAAAAELGYTDYRQSKRLLIKFTPTVNNLVKQLQSIHTRAAEIFAMGFAEWCGDNYVKLHGVWVHRFNSQIDSNNYKTTEQLLTLYNQSA